MPSPITSSTIVCLTVYSGADHWKHRSLASLACVWRIHRWTVIYPHKWPVTRKKFPFDDFIMSHVIMIVNSTYPTKLFSSDHLLFHLFSRQYVWTGIVNLVPDRLFKLPAELNNVIDFCNSFANFWVLLKIWRAMSHKTSATSHYHMLNWIHATSPSIKRHAYRWVCGCRIVGINGLIYRLFGCLGSHRRWVDHESHLTTNDI